MVGFLKGLKMLVEQLHEITLIFHSLHMYNKQIVEHR